MTVLVIIFGMSASPANARYPVVYNFFAGIPNELQHPGGSLPGSNDWNCTPPAAHPDPVVLVHGIGGGAQTNWGVLVPVLANEGYCVYALSYGGLPLPWPLSALGGFGKVEESARVLGTFVDRVRNSTRASQVDIIGHSEGTAVPNYYAKRLGGAAKINRYVAIAPAWMGSDALNGAEVTAFARQLGIRSFPEAFVGPCGACSELFKDSPFLRDLNSDGIYAPNIVYTNIISRDDELVVPYTAGYVLGPRTTNIVVQEGCPTDFSDHLAIAGSSRTAGFILNALDPAHPRPVPCTFIPPLTG